MLACKRCRSARLAAAMSESSRGSLASRLLRPFAEVRARRSGTALLMFVYSFLAMTSYNIVKPITRSQFIASLGADNLPWVQFAAGMVIGMHHAGLPKAIVAGAARAGPFRCRRRGMVVLLVDLLGAVPDRPAEWVSVALLPPRADPRHPADQPVLDAGQRHLRPATGQAPVRLHRRRDEARRCDRRGPHPLIATTVGTNTLLLSAPAVLALCILIVIVVLRREANAVAGAGGEDEVGGLGPKRGAAAAS